MIQINCPHCNKPYYVPPNDGVTYSCSCGMNFVVNLNPQHQLPQVPQQVSSSSLGTWGCAMIIGGTLFFGALGVAITSLNRGRTPSSTTSRNQTRASDQTLSKRSIIPDDVTFQIIENHTLLHYKRSIDIRINRKVSEEVLTEIAMNLKRADPKAYDRTFICFYLPGQIVDSGCWAIATFDPGLKVQIVNFQEL